MKISQSSISRFSFELLIITLPLQWFNLAKAIGLTFKPIHLSIFFSIIAFLAIKKKITVTKDFLSKIWPFLLFYISYLLISNCSLLWTPDLSVGITIVLKITIYFLLFLLFAILVYSTEPQNIAYAVYVGTTIGCIIFFLIVIYVFYILERNILLEYAISIISADSKSLQWAFYPTLFNFSSGEIVSKGNVEFVGTSLRNTLMGAFIFYIITLGMYRPLVSQLLKKPYLEIMGRIVIGCSTCLIIFSVSRSNIIVLLTIFLLVCLFKWIRPKHRGITYKNVLIVFMALFLSLFFYQYIYSIGQILGERLLSITEDNRFAMYNEAFYQISKKVFMGFGLGTEVETVTGTMHRVHNIFLSSWLETGIAGFVLSILFYLAIVFFWFKQSILLIRYPQKWLLSVSPEWTMTLPVLPLVRSLISGAGGSFTYVEWLCLAFFFGTIIQNQVTLHNLQTQTSFGLLSPQNLRLGDISG